MVQNPSLKKQGTTDYVDKLERACKWLDIEQGRARAYLHLLREFDRRSQLCDADILSYYESSEIVELFELWETRISAFPGLEDKIRRACRQGPVLRENEKVSSSSNRPRNDAFAFVMSGKFMAAGISVTNVDGVASRSPIPAPDADFSFLWQGVAIDVECKRLQSEAQLLKRAKDARNQILRADRCGIIAIDCSVLYRPSGTLLETDSPERAERDASRWLETNIKPQVSRSLKPNILGFILYSGFPAMTATGILNSKGTVVRRRDCISSLLVVGNISYPDPNVLHDIAQLLAVRGSTQ